MSGVHWWVGESMDRNSEGMAPSPRRDELGRLIVRDLEVLCGAIKMLTRMVDEMGEA